MINLKELIKLANQATLGPWKLFRDPAKADQCLITAMVEDHSPSFKKPTNPLVKPELQIVCKVSYSFDDGKYLEAANPTTVRTLCQALQKAMSVIKTPCLHTGNDCYCYQTLVNTYEELREVIGD